MKKLFLAVVLLTCFGLAASAQYLEKNYSRIENLSDYTMSADTAYTIDISDGSYYLDSEFVWSGLDATDATIQVQTSSTLTGENFVDFSNLGPLELNSASSLGKIVDWTYPITTKRVRWKVLHGSNTTGTLKTYIHVVKYR